MRWLLRRALLPLTVILGAESAYLFATGSPGATAFLLIALGTMAALAIWRPMESGFPGALLALQNLVVYGLPIVIGHEVSPNTREITLVRPDSRSWFSVPAGAGVAFEHDGVPSRP